MRVLSLISVIAWMAVAPAVAEPSSAEGVVARAISVHDPEGAWDSGAFRMTFAESRPDGSVRDTVVVVDNARGRFEIDTGRDGHRLQGVLDADVCAWRLDGSADYADEERERFRLTCERLEWIRNYYVYLWGLPMKLRDPGTRLGRVVENASFQGRPAVEVRVSYDEEVGSDVWYFYFDPDEGALVGYRFYHDETAGDGEYIVLEELVEAAGLRLPKQRAWSTHQGDEYLGTDSLVSLERFAPQ